MPENPTAPSAASKKRGQPQAALNQAQVKQLTKAQEICASARQADYLERLTERGITENFLQKLEEDIAACRQKSAEAMQNTILRRQCTVKEGEAKRALLRALTEIQTAAKQKYARANPVALRDYHIGKSLSANRAALEQYSQNIIDKLADDDLPGITAKKEAALGKLRADWIAARTEKAACQTRATTLRAERDALVESITDLRIQVQLAAEAQWPSSDLANGGIRRAFLLQPARPFSIAA
jgi:hypothetical protein